MALWSGLQSSIRRIVLAEARTSVSSVRYYCEPADNTEGEEKKAIDPAKDRTKIIPPETSIRYMQSKAYQQTYGEKPVWFLYRRNHKGGFAPRKTRKTCVRNGIISTGNPCPICRDEYLVLDHRNTKLLEQFISEHTGQQIQNDKLVVVVQSPSDISELLGYSLISEHVFIFKAMESMFRYCEHPDSSDISDGILDAFKTGLCRKKQKELLVAIERAWDHGNLTYDVPFRKYDYSLYYKKELTQ